MSDRLFSLGGLKLRALPIILTPVALAAAVVIFVTALAVLFQITTAVDSNRTAISLVEHHSLQIADLKNALWLTIDKGGDSGNKNVEQTLEGFDKVQWLNEIEFIGRSHSQQTFLPLTIQARIPALQIATRNLKILLNEISLSIASLTSSLQTKPGESAEQARKALQAVQRYDEAVRPSLDARAQSLENLKKSLARYQSTSASLLLLMFFSAVGIAFFYFLRYLKSARRIRDQKLILGHQLEQMDSGLLIINSELEVEYAELEALELDQDGLHPGSHPLEVYLAASMDPTDVKTWKVALTKLLLKNIESPSSTELETFGVKLKLGQSYHEYQICYSTLTLSKDTKILAHFMPASTYSRQAPERPKAPVQPARLVPAIVPAKAAVAPSKQIKVKAAPAPLNNTQLKKQFSRRLELIETLTQMDQSIAAEFFKDTRKALQACEMRITALEQGHHNPSTMLSGLLQVFHQIKGDAAILGLTDFSRSFHELEDIFANLPQPPSSDHQKMALASEQFEQAKRLFDRIYRLFTRFTKKDQKFDEAEGRNFSKQIAQFARKVARDLNKEIKIIDDNLNSKFIPDKQLSQIMTLLSQLIRNAIAHGIENAETRKSLHKTEYGCLHLSAQEVSNSLIIRVRDDGKGIEMPKILSKAKQLGAIDPNSHARMNSKILFDILATPGLTTKTKPSEYAGRGAGLDLVKSIVTELNGHVRVDTKPGQFTEVIVNIPMVKTENNDSDDIPLLIEETQDLEPA